MERQSVEYTIFDAATPKAITSSTDATPIVVTATSHGFSTGDYVAIQAHTTNIAANGVFKILVVTANTFQLLDNYTGASVAGSGAGAGASGYAVKINVPHVLLTDFIHAVLQLDTSGSMTATLTAYGSIGKINASAANPTSAANLNNNAPNFGATKSVGNPYNAVQVIDYDTGSAINGATGIALTGTDFHKLYEVNINGLKYLNFIPTAWTQGAFTLKLKLFTNK